MKAIDHPVLSRTNAVARILAFARPERRLLGAAIVFLVISSASGLAFPIVIRAVIDGAVVTHDALRIDQAAMIMAAILLANGISTALRYMLFNLGGERVVARLRKQAYRSLLLQEIAFFDRHPTGELTSRLSTDAAVIQETLSGNFSVGLQSAASVIGGVVMLVYTSPQLAALTLVVVPPLTGAAFLYGRVLRRLSRAVQRGLAECNRIAEETISGVRTVRTFAAEEREVTRYGRAVDVVLALARHQVLAAGGWMGATAIAGYGAIVLVLWYGGHLVVAHELTAGALASFLVYTLFISMSLSTLSEKWAELMRAAGAADGLFELLDRSPAMASTGGKVLTALDGQIEFRDVHFTYPSRANAPVLRGIDFTFRPGEVIALVGRSGAGKSTIAGLLSRLYDPTSGTVSVDGIPQQDLDASWLRRQVGIVSQEPVLFSCSIAENIGYARENATPAEIELAAKMANAHDFIQGFPDGYATLVGERGVQLSGGQKQRVAIARALLKDPRILILDEATSALDAESEALVQEALQRLMKGRTTLVIAHRLSTIKNADRVLVMERGVMVQSGRHTALVKEDGLYRRLVERQFVPA